MHCNGYPVIIGWTVGQLDGSEEWHKRMQGMVRCASFFFDTNF
jgi:hypothetical protein